jgi:hypothetical protein
MTGPASGTAGPVTRRVRNGPRAAAAAAGVVLAVMAGACSSSGAGGIKPIGVDSTRPTSSTPSSSTTAAPSTTKVDPSAAAIVVAYRQAEDVYLAVAGHYPIVPLDPRLPQVMTGVELSTVRKNLTLAALAGEYASGPLDLAPVVTAVNGTVAMITDCSFDHSRIINGRTQQTVTTGDTKRALQKVTMMLESGTWKIGDVQTVGSGCVPGP